MKKIFQIKEDTILETNEYKHLIKKGAKAIVVEYIDKDKVCIILKDDPFKEKLILSKSKMI